MVYGEGLGFHKLERLVGVEVEGGFEGFDAVEEGGDGGMGLVLKVMEVEVVACVRFGVELSWNKVWFGDEE